MSPASPRTGRARSCGRPRKSCTPPRSPSPTFASTPSPTPRRTWMADARLDAIARGCRVQIIRMLTHAGSGHPGGSLSVIDLLVAIAFGRLRHDPRRPDWPERDRIVLSKGHAVPALYCVMAKAGYFSEDALITLRKLGSPLQGHPDRVALAGIEAATGSLRHGLSGPPRLRLRPHP